MTKAFHETYRPKRFEDVLGQSAVVKALKKIIADDSSHAFLFSSTAPGIGKTSLARICAKEIGCDKNEIIQIPAAVYTSVDDMRKVVETMSTPAFTQNGKRAMILDESHRISGNGWDALLQAIEEPANHAYYFFCTTNIAKIPATVKSRCNSFNLKPLDDKEIFTLLNMVIQKERIKLAPDILDLIIDAANGSARQALVYLASCAGATTLKEASQLMDKVVDSAPVIKLCQLLLKGGSWSKAMSIFTELEEEPPEGTRIIICHYMAKVLKGSKSEQSAGAVLEILDCFSQSFNPNEGHAPLLLAIGRAVIK